MSAAASDHKHVKPSEKPYEAILHSLVSGIHNGILPDKKALDAAFKEQGKDLEEYVLQTADDAYIEIAHSDEIDSKIRESFCTRFGKNLRKPQESTALGVNFNGVRDYKWTNDTVAGTNIGKTGAVTTQVWGTGGQQFDQAIASTEVMVYAAIPVILLYKSQGKEPPYEMLLRIIIAAGSAIIPWNSAFYLVFGTWTYSPAGWSVFADPKIFLACNLTGVFESATQNMMPKLTVDSPLGDALKKKDCTKILYEILKLPFTIPQTLIMDGLLSQDFWTSVLPVGWLPGATWAYVWVLATLGELSPFYSGVAVAASVAVGNYLVAEFNPLLNEAITEAIPAKSLRETLDLASPTKTKSGWNPFRLFGCCKEKPPKPTGMPSDVVDNRTALLSPPAASK